MPEITNIDTKLKYENSVVKTWRYGDLATIVLIQGVNVNKAVSSLKIQSVKL